MPPSWLPVVCWPSSRFRDLEKRHPDLCLRVRGAFAPCAGLCPKFPSFARTLVILREGPTDSGTTSFSLAPSATTLLPNQATFEGTKTEDFEINALEDTVRPILDDFLEAAGKRGKRT